MTKQTEAKPKEVEAVETSTPMVVSETQIVVPKDYKPNYTRQQIEVIKEQFAKGASDVELKMFLYVCRDSELDPFSRQVHLVPRWDSRLGKEVRMVIFGIDGLRSIAEKTGAYAGNSDPIFGDEIEAELIKTDYKTKKDIVTKFNAPSRATVTVKKVVQGVLCDFTATVEWTEYYPGGKGGMMWAKMPKNMLSKCAEAKALRKAFPKVMSGRYVGEEMHQAIAIAPQEAPQSDFDKARGMIGKIMQTEALDDLKGKIEGSKKYTAKEKKDLIEVIDERIKSVEYTKEKVSKDSEPEK